MTRRRFTFWLGFGLFTLAEKLHLSCLDALAAAAMGDDDRPAGAKKTPPEHWTAAEDDDWKWFERETYLDGQWVLTGTTTPISKETGEPQTDNKAYLDEGQLPPSMRPTEQRGPSQAEDDADAANEEGDKARQQLPLSGRRARHGRPPSKWLRSLNADEIRIWLKTIEVPEAGVSGMTYWEHLTRDHSFDPAKIEGLAEAEQAQLHAAAHFGY
jgi:hypothetical protein